MAASGPAPTGPYPERVETAEGAIDRLVSQVGWHLHRVLRRRLGDASAFVAAVQRHAAEARDKPLAQRLPGLRYRMRRAGFTPDLAAECFGLYCAALTRSGASLPPPDILAAGQALLDDSIVDIDDSAARVQALALAAAAHAIRGTPVHLLATSDFRAQRVAAELRPGFDALGIGLACVAPGMAPRAREDAYRSPIVCATHRDVALAYLQDRLLIRGKPRLLLRALDGKEAGLVLPGLHCALVEEADLVMLDDAYAPVTITVEADQAQERLLYEQALELARACEPGRDFELDQGGLHLTEEGCTRIKRLVSPLGGVWGATQQREELVVTALAALHTYERGVDYAVERGRVVFPKPDPGSGEAAEPDEALRKLIEFKEGCGLAGARDVIARISVPGFFRRYLHVAGVCADARGLEEEFRLLYELRVSGAGAPAARGQCGCRVFGGAQARRAAVVEAVRERAAEGAVVVAVRTPREAQTLIEALAQAGLGAALVRGRLDEEEQAALARLEHPGAIVVSLFPAECNVSRTGGCRLHLIVAELHDALRHVAHIARAYRADACEQLIALDEEGVTSTGGARAPGGPAADGELPADEAQRVARAVQRQIERSRELTRRDLIMRDEYMSALLAFSGRKE